MDMYHIIFSKSTVQSRKERGTHRCKTFSFDFDNLPYAEK